MREAVAVRKNGNTELLKEVRRHQETFKAIIYITLAILVLIISLSKMVTKASPVTYNDDYHKLNEKEYVSNIKQVLAEQGMENAGVSLLKTIDPDNGVFYKLNIHHRSIEKMDKVKLIELMEVLELVEFPYCDDEVIVSFI